MLAPIKSPQRNRYRPGNQLNAVIFTDLDGTLLDRQTYSWEQAASAINWVKERRIPLVFCSSKTRVEQEVIQAELNIAEPFIVENGSAIFFPEGYFPGEVFSGSGLSENDSRRQVWMRCRNDTSKAG